MMAIKQSPEVEQRVLGSLINIGDYTSIDVQKAMILLDISCFYKQETQEIFKLIKKRYDNHELFDVINMLDLLNNAHVGVFNYFERLIKNGWFTKNTLDSDIDTLIKYATLRKQLRIMRKTLIDVSAETIPSQASTMLDNSLTEMNTIKYPKIQDGESYEYLANQFLSGEMELDEKIPTNLKCIDEPLGGGIQNKGLVVIAGGAGLGKTNFAIYLMHQLSKSRLDKQAVFFSLEMPNHAIWKRHIGIIGKKRFESLTEHERTLAISESLGMSTTIYDSARPDITFIETTARLKAMQKPLSVIVVDYLGLVQNSEKFERYDLKQADIAQRLAALAIELNCVVIALSQVNRKPSERAKDDRCPYPSDAADSSGSHRSSTLWLGIDRPETYQDCPSHDNQFVIKCRKNRYGSNFDAILAFNNGTFCEYDFTSAFYTQKTYRPSHDIFV